MGTFGFFLFLSVLVVAATWRSAKLAQSRRDVLIAMVERGQPLGPEHLELLAGNAARPIAGSKIWIALLLFMGLGTIALSIAFWEAGTLPGLFAGLFALWVAYATWGHGRK